MDKTAQRYWSSLRTWLPGYYKYRTALTHNYVLQVSGQENGRRHKLVLYCLMLTGRLKRVWSRRFTVSNIDASLPTETAKALALEILEDMLKDRREHLKHVDSCAQIERELSDAVGKALDEYGVHTRE